MKVPDGEVPAGNGLGQSSLGRSAERAGRGMSHHILEDSGLDRGQAFCGNTTLGYAT